MKGGDMMTLTDKEKVARYDELKRKERRYWAKQVLMLRKATEAGIKVTDAEIDAYVKSKYK